MTFIKNGESLCKELKGPRLGFNHKNFNYKKKFPTKCPCYSLLRVDVILVDVIPVDVIPVDVIPVDVIPVDVIPADVIPVDVIPVEVIPPSQKG